MTDAKHAVLTLVKIKHRTPETRLNPYLIYLSRLKQMHVELTDKHMDAHGGACDSYVLYTISGMTLRYDVSKNDHFLHKTVKNIKKNRHAKSSKMTIFRAGSRAAIIILTKRWSQQV